MDNEELMVREKQIVSLVTAYYEKFDFLQVESLDDLLKKALDRYLDSELSLEQINEELMELIVERKKVIDDRFDKDKVKDNHKEIYSKLDELVKLLNEYDIDYQLAGALCAYIKYGEESNRVHDDIDLNVNEKDLDKFKNVCEQMGLKYSDKRFDSPRVLKDGIPSGEHEVIAELDGSDFHIGVFCFQRNKDGSVDNRNYYKDEDDNAKVWNEHLSPKYSEIVFGREAVEFNGKKLYITPPEYVYALKSYTRHLKDYSDLEFMEDKIDKDKLNKIKEIGKTDREVLYLDAKNNNKVDEIDTMLEHEKNNEQVLEKPKVYVKKDNKKKRNKFF